MLTVDPYVFNSKLSFAELIIPTKDSVRYKFLARTLLTNSKFVLMAGPTGAWNACTACVRNCFDS